MDDLQKRFPRTFAVLENLAKMQAELPILWGVLDDALADEAVRIAATKLALQIPLNAQLKRKGGPVEKSEKERARHIAQNAVATRKLPKPDKCSACKSFMLMKYLHAHHEDYSKPLEVQWLCPRCHGEQHTDMQTMIRQAPRNPREYTPAALNQWTEKRHGGWRHKMIHEKPPE